MSDPCEKKGSTRWFYTGNQVGDFNFTGDFNFVAGGPPGSNLSAGALEPVFFPPPVSREPWNAAGAVLDQKLLDASYPDIELTWAIEITLKDTIFKVSNKNVYIEDEDGSPRFYEARLSKSPSTNTTLGEWLNPNFEIGDLKFTLNNRDGYFNAYLPQGENYTQWITAKVVVLVGFGEKRSNYFEMFTGFVTAKQGITTTEEEITVKCYDKFDIDEIPLPPLQFTSINFPDIQEGVNGKGVPLVYGDWTEEVGDYGEVPAYCLNALEENPTSYTFKISANSLSSIDEVYLHRGDRKADSPDGPIRFADAFITRDLENGLFSIPALYVDVLEDIFIVLDKGTTGVGTMTDLITSDKPTTNFITKGVKAGDVVIRTKTSERATVSIVTNNQLVLTGGIAFEPDDEFSVITTQYSYRKSDKVSVKCVGKSVKNISKNRLSDVGLETSIPVGLSVDLDGTYWFADNTAQKIYKISFRNEIIEEIDYADVHASLTEISGLSIQTDNSLWIFDAPTSTIYRYMVAAGELGLSFSTVDVIGILAPLTAGAGLTIDTGNILYIVDNATGIFYKINPFASPAPTLVTTWSISAFDSAAVEILDLSADVNELNLALVDRQTGKFYRIDQTTGALISSFVITDEVNDQMTFVVGVSIAQDGTVFFLNRATKTLHNYNEFPDSQYNPGFIARDIIQNFTGKVSTDFDLSWNDMSREHLSEYRARLYLDEKTNVITAANKFLQQFNSNAYVRFGKYALFHISFDTFQSNGDILREGDIKLDSFNPSKEYNQYFNSAYADYAKKPFSGESTRSDTYVSPVAIAAAGGKEISKKFELSWIYRRADMDRIMPLFVRLAAAEPEFIDVTISWRRLFTQLNDFFRINFDADFDCTLGRKRGGRRFNMVPAFVRSITTDLDSMTLKLKLWSLGSTQFGDYIPVGPIIGGEFDDIVLTNLGTVGYISPTGIITGSGVDSLTLEDADGMDAESRQTASVGLAWAEGYFVAIVDGATHEVVETIEISSVSGQDITFTAPISTTVVPTVRNAAGFITGGHYLRYSEYSFASDLQKQKFCYFGRPETSYPPNSAQEIEEQRAGSHSFPDGRVPYILYPEAFAP